MYLRAVCLVLAILLRSVYIKLYSLVDQTEVHIWEELANWVRAISVAGARPMQPTLKLPDG